MGTVVTNSPDASNASHVYRVVNDLTGEVLGVFDSYGSANQFANQRGTRTQRTTLPELTVTLKVDPDPIRDKIFEGEYNGRHFTPTPENIQHFLDLYLSDKHIASNYGGSAWGKVAASQGAAAAAAMGLAATPGAIITAIETAPQWGPKVMPFIAKYYAAPTAAGGLWDYGSKALTGTTTSEIAKNWMVNHGVNETVADIGSGAFNPGYWINFGGTGQYTKPFFNKIGLGLPEFGKVELSPAIQASINSLVPKSNFLTKVVEPISQLIDRNLYRFLVAANPFLLRFKPTTINSSDFPRFNFVKDASEAQSSNSYLLFKSNVNNEKAFGNAMKLKVPNLNSTYYKEGFTTNGARLDQALTPFLGGIAGTDIVLSDSNDRSPWLRGVEYALLGKWGLNKLIQNRFKNISNISDNYMKSFRDAKSLIDDFFSINPINIPDGYRPTIRGVGPVKIDKWNSVKKPGFNYKDATFDDLIKFLGSKANSNNYHINGFRIDNDKLYNQDGIIVAERGSDGKINLINESELRGILSKNINIFDYNTGKRFTGQISIGDNGTVNIPEEYTNILKNNIDYVQNVLFPGSNIKVFGSSAGVTEAKFPHATHDIDFYITLNEIDKLLLKGMLSESDRINPGTYTYKHNPNLFGEQGNIDLNVIEQTADGKATGIRAEELYKQYFPDEYFLALRDFKSRQLNNDPDQEFHINKTPEELLEAVNPSSKTIMDSFDIDYTQPNKGKHALRSWAHLVYSDPDQVSQGINQYARSMLGSRVKLFPATVDLLKDKELNLQILKKLGINLRDFELDRIASDPQRMKNVLDAWYMMDNTAMRYIRGTWFGTRGNSPENFIKSATTWDPVNNGGNANGVGLNTTIGGDSEWGGDLKAFISPNTQYHSTNLLDLIDEINNNFGRNPEARTLLWSAGKGTPQEQVANLLRIADEKGWSFLQNGSRYGSGRYASATRPFDITTDYIGFSPTRTRLNPMIPRITARVGSNPLEQIEFAGTRTIPAKLDYYYVKPSSIFPIFKINRNNKYLTFNGPKLDVNPKSDIISLKEESFIGGTLPALSTIFYISSKLSKNHKNNWINNMVNKPDEVIQNMSEQDKSLFTPEGINKLKQKYLMLNFDDDDVTRFAYYDLKNIYDKYKDK